MEAYEEEETPENHALVMEGRRKRLEELCKKFEVETRIEHSSLFHRWKHFKKVKVSKLGSRSEPINRCTGRFFRFQEKDFFICNVLKGGSTSWSFFFGENNITAAFIADCRENGTCPKKSELRLLQVSTVRSGSEDQSSVLRFVTRWSACWPPGGISSKMGAGSPWTGQLPPSRS